LGVIKLTWLGKREVKLPARGQLNRPGIEGAWRGIKALFDHGQGIGPLPTSVMLPSIDAEPNRETSKYNTGKPVLGARLPAASAKL